MCVLYDFSQYVVGSTTYLYKNVFEIIYYILEVFDVSCLTDIWKVMLSIPLLSTKPYHTVNFKYFGARNFESWGMYVRIL